MLNREGGGGFMVGTAGDWLGGVFHTTLDREACTW